MTRSRIKQGASVLIVILCYAGVQSCSSASHSSRIAASDSTPAGKLAGTRWRLVEIQSMDDAIGTARPKDRNSYTMDLNTDGTVALRLNCNRGRGTWSAKPAAHDAEGGFRIGSLALTRAQCPPPSLDGRIARDMDLVRSYLLKDGRLYLSLMADGGIYVWEPSAETN